MPSVLLTLLVRWQKAHLASQTPAPAILVTCLGNLLGSNLPVVICERNKPVIQNLKLAEVVYGIERSQYDSYWQLFIVIISRTAIEGSCVIPVPWPCRKAFLYRSTGGVPLSRQTWISHLLQGRQDRHFQSCLGKQRDYYINCKGAL